MNERQADKLLSEASPSLRRGDYRGVLQRDEGADPKAHYADQDRYVKESQRIANDDPHKALHEVRPWKGLLRDVLENRQSLEPIWGVMDACGFGRTGRGNWLKHWIRRGAS